MAQDFSGVGDGIAQVWVTKIWTSPLNDNNLLRTPSTGDSRWGYLKWEEENTDDESKAYVRIDILDSNNAILQANVKANILLNRDDNGVTYTWRRGKVDLSSYSNIGSTDIKIRVKLYSLDRVPTVDRLRLLPKNGY